MVKYIEPQIEVTEIDLEDSILQSSPAENMDLYDYDEGLEQL